MQKLISFLVRHVPRKHLQKLSGFGLSLLSIFYRGTNFTCPICKNQFRKFLPYGRLKARPNALCPSCQSLERHRLIWIYLQEKTDFFKVPLNVLHFAPEACFVKAFERQHGSQYITADIESPLAKMKMDIHAIPFEDQYFDVILCNHVLEHVEDDRKALKEIYRVLKPGGWAILQVPFFSPVPDTTYEDSSIVDPRQRELAYGQSDHVRKYGRDYSARIKESGLACYELDFAQSVAPKYGVQANEIIYLARRA